jgi:hypothetical protein
MAWMYHPGKCTPQKYPSYWKNMQNTLGYKNILGLGGIGKTCRTPSDTKAPLALRKSAREKTSLGSGGIEQRIPKRVAFGSNLLML